jgi:hypothetical protein
MFIASNLVAMYEAKSSEIIALLKTNHVYILPLLNVQAYKELSENWATSKTVHIKNFNKVKACDSDDSKSGVNLKYNWDNKWGIDDIGSSPDPCDPNYRGESAESEHEIVALKNLIAGLEVTLYFNYYGMGG